MGIDFLWEKSLLHGCSETKMGTGLRGSSEFLNKEELSGCQAFIFSLQLYWSIKMEGLLKWCWKLLTSDLNFCWYCVDTVLNEFALSKINSCYTKEKCSFLLCHQSVEFSMIWLVDNVVRNLKALFAAGTLFAKRKLLKLCKRMSQLDVRKLFYKHTIAV